MNKYSNDKNVLMLLSLMKQHGIKKVIASPGTTNLAIVGSMQHDDWFEMYSCVDERSAAYMACGLAAESGEAVAIICTGATASRNYYPGLTEAYYRKLPILVIAGSHGELVIGHLHSQVIDRTESPKDTFVYKAFINPAKDDITRWYNNVEINKSLIKLHQHGGGPVLLNVVASSGERFDSEELPRERVIHFHKKGDALPELPKGKVAIFIGAHIQMPQQLQNAIDDFCASHNAVVFCDHTSGYQGKYRFNATLVHGQFFVNTDLDRPDLLIHIGEVSGDTYTTGHLKPKAVWRVSADGEVRDLFKTLTCVFEMDEQSFFTHYTNETVQDDSYLNDCLKLYEDIYNNLPEFGFGNIYIAKTLSANMPKNCVIHFGIYNSLRTWNLFRLDPSIQTSCNVGGFGIDGACSTLIGASLANPEKIHFLNVGDLAFFYDLNAIGNRHVGNNVRIILINNGRGVEFRKKDHPGYRFGMEADLYMAAAGHYGNQSTELVKHYATDLGFVYLSASTKEEFETVKERFLTPKLTDKPMLLEVFPDYKDDVENLDMVRHTLPDDRNILEKAEDSTKKVLKSGIKSLFKK